MWLSTALHIEGAQSTLFFVFLASYNKNFNEGGISDIFGMTGMKNVLWNFNFLLLGDIVYK